MTEEDKELELLKAKRLREMQKNLSQRQRSEEPKEIPVTTSTREIVVKQLGHRGLEVLENAEAQFPEETRLVTAKLAELIQAGEITERVRVQTTINVEQDGKLVSWSDKIKGVRNTESQETTTDENP